MNKNRFFMISMLIINMLLSMMRITGLIPHIIVSVIGLTIMILLTIQTKSEWKKPALEILMRTLYLVAIISGGMLMKIHGVSVLGFVHKISSLLFLILLLILYIPKWNKK